MCANSYLEILTIFFSNNTTVNCLTLIICNNFWKFFVFFGIIFTSDAQKHRDQRLNSGSVDRNDEQLPTHTEGMPLRTSAASTDALAVDGDQRFSTDTKVNQVSSSSAPILGRVSLVSVAVPTLNSSTEQEEGSDATVERNSVDSVDENGDGAAGKAKADGVRLHQQQEKAGPLG